MFPFAAGLWAAVGAQGQTITLASTGLPYPTIQAAIDAAVDDDTVFIEAPSIAIPDAVTVRDQTLTFEGIGTPTLQPTNASDGFFRIDGASVVTLRGLTIDGASSRRAVRVAEAAEATIEDCTVQNTAAPADLGGAVLVDGTARLTVIGSIFQDSSALEGGFIAVAGDAALDVWTSGFHNGAASIGGAISCRTTGGCALGLGTHLADNAATDGGGLFCGGPICDIADAVFSNNTASGDGGGAFLDAGAGTVQRTWFCGNSADLKGGGLFIADQATVSHAVFLGNAADLRSTLLGEGGAIAVEGGDVQLSAIDFLANTATGLGAAVSASGSVLTADHTLFEGNAGTTYSVWADAPPAFSHTLWADPGGPINGGDLGTAPVSGPTLLPEPDPALCSANVLTRVPGSAAIDAGAALPTDPDGTARDIGAFGLPCLVDLDADGYGSAPLSGDGWGCTAPAQTTLAGDCEDADPTVHPNAPEVCNGRDDDCDGAIEFADGSIPVDAALYRYDGDGDGYGAGPSAPYCVPEDKWVSGALDCDDDNAAVWPGAPERCDEIDNDCDAAIDEDVTVPGWYLDQDGDGYGDRSTEPVIACFPPSDPIDAPYVAEGGDCADRDPDTWPGAPERCDEIDNDCNDIVDDGLPQIDHFLDRDGDGYGDPGTLATSCASPSGAALIAGDCDDVDPDRNPGVDEICNAVDDDCDGETDEPPACGAGPDPRTDRDPDPATSGSASSLRFRGGQCGCAGGAPADGRWFFALSLPALWRRRARQQAIACRSLPPGGGPTTENQR